MAGVRDEVYGGNPKLHARFDEEKRGT